MCRERSRVSFLMRPFCMSAVCCRRRHKQAIPSRAQAQVSGPRHHSGSCHAAWRGYTGQNTMRRLRGARPNDEPVGHARAETAFPPSGRLSLFVEKTTARSLGRQPPAERAHESLAVTVTGACIRSAARNTIPPRAQLPTSCPLNVRPKVARLARPRGRES
jgi:hypothetical protein